MQAFSVAYPYSADGGGKGVVERSVNRRKQQRAIANRFDKRALMNRAMVVIAVLVLSLAQ